MRFCRLDVVPLLLLSGACGAGSLAAHPTIPASASPTRVAFLQPSRVLPDVSAGAVPVRVDADGTRHFLLMNMRLTVRPDGSILRAPGQLSGAATQLIPAPLPSRLGGGFLFLASSPSSTQIWFADDWLATLRPVVRFAQGVFDVIPGFDRVYLRAPRSPNAFLALDPVQGFWMDVGPLPVPLRSGSAAFADPWRAVVVSDVRGPLATFNAGASWLPVDVPGEVASVGVRGEDLFLQVADSAFALTADGALLDVGATPATPQLASSEPFPIPRSAPLGPNPLHLAVDRGYPYSDSRIVVAHAGQVALLSQETGAVVQIRHHAYPASYDDCRAIALGAGVGFVCSEPLGATTVFSLGPSLRLTSVMHWPEPRAVFPSSNGALVVRAPCPGSSDRDDGGQYCIRDVHGRTRELRFQGDLGAERVVPLQDGRLAVLVAPRPGADGRLVLIDGTRAVTQPLHVEALPEPVAALVRRGLWMRGAEEIAPGSVGVWVEAGGPLLGIRVDLQGQLRAGAVQSPSSMLALSGRFGAVWKRSGEALETTDGGMTWTAFDIPGVWDDRTDAPRGCSPVGCVLGPFLRVGWGPAADDAALSLPLPSPSASSPPYEAPARTKLLCAATGRSSPPAVLVRDAAPSRLPVRGFPPAGSSDTARGWVPFGPVPAPALAPGDVGVGSGREYGEFRSRVYAWGPKDGDWLRSGRWLTRFENPYDPVSPPFSTALSPSPWADLAAATTRIGSVTSAELDPAGNAGVMSWCPMPSACLVFAISPGEPPLALTTVDPAGMPAFDSVVRTEDGWFLLARRAGSVSALWFADLAGRTKRIAQFPRTGSGYGARDLFLARRTHGSEVAVWTVSSDQQGHDTWIVMPFDASSGRVSEPIVVGPANFGGVLPPPCVANQDGWLLEASIPSAVELSLTTGSPFGGSLRALLRVDSRRSCVQALSARAQGVELGAVSAVADLPPGKPVVPAIVWDHAANRRFEMHCVQP